jgi:hypothetical protein
MARAAAIEAGACQISATRSAYDRTRVTLCIPFDVTRFQRSSPLAQTGLEVFPRWWISGDGARRSGLHALDEFREAGELLGHKLLGDLVLEFQCLLVEFGGRLADEDFRRSE